MDEAAEHELNQAIGDVLNHVIPHETEWIVLYRLPGEGRTRVATTLTPQGVRLAVRQLAAGSMSDRGLTRHEPSDTH